MSYFLDTNTCIYLLKGLYPSLTDRLLKERPPTVKIPAMVLAELYAGSRESSDPERTKTAIDAFVSTFEIVGFDQKAASSFGDIRSALDRASVKVGPYDLIIAATVIAHNGILITNNTREFSRIEGLAVENWAG